MLREPNYHPRSFDSTARHVQYEIDRARAGNSLFCPTARGGQNLGRGLPPLYEDAAHMLKHLVASGLKPACSYHEAITSAAHALSLAASKNVRSSDCAEYVLYCLKGMSTPAQQKQDAKLRAIIGTHYANLLIAQALA